MGIDILLMGLLLAIIGTLLAAPLSFVPACMFTMSLVSLFLRIYRCHPLYLRFT